MSEEPARYTLCLASHSRSPPLHPAPWLKFDLRSVPNPSRSLRQTNTGKHWALRKELLKDPVFQSELDRAQTAIAAAMADFELSRKDSVAQRNRTPEEAGHLAQEDSQDLEGVEQANPGPEDVLRVSCFCEMGKHRSPAFVESLAAAGGWPENWDVKVIHRELDGPDDTEGLIGKNRRNGPAKKRRWKRSARFPSEVHEHNGIWKE
ncbi:hypothetical protein SLS56_001233 [Neofusicoccum ribis]|uniref:Uncharacterized protein n=1 Tax=Neofusicoccum ribis TaxID=45134 RepID=A0ABR3T9P3_9PEZI